MPEVVGLFARPRGVAEVLDEEGKRAAGIDHPRAGELVLVAAPGAWFTYYYWLDDARAPDFARCVEIHRKPGYDPAELFFDPDLAAPKLAAGWKLMKKTPRLPLGVRRHRPRPVRGQRVSRRRPSDPASGPLLIGPKEILAPGSPASIRELPGPRARAAAVTARRRRP